MSTRLTDSHSFPHLQSTAAAVFHLRDVVALFADDQNRFTPKQWQVMRLYYDEGMTQGQIADRLGVSRSSVSARLGRARTEMEAIQRENRPSDEELEELLQRYIES